MLLERKDNLEKWGEGEVDAFRSGRVATFVITLQFNCICFVCGKK